MKTNYAKWLTAALERSQILRLWFIAIVVLIAWQILPNRYMGPYQAWNPHVIMEFAVTIFAISIAGNAVVQLVGLRYGVLLVGLIGGSASGIATIFSLGAIAKAHPLNVHRVAMAAVLSNIATLVQLTILAHLLAPALSLKLIQPMLFGVVGLVLYVVVMLVFIDRSSDENFAPKLKQASHLFNWVILFALIGLVCIVSFASSWLTAIYGQYGLWISATLSGLLDTHAIVPTIASLMAQSKLSADDALIPLLIALSANTCTKSLAAIQSGGWIYGRKVLEGILIAILCIWIGYFW